MHAAGLTGSTPPSQSAPAVVPPNDANALLEVTTPRLYLSHHPPRPRVPATQPHPYRLDKTKLLSGTAPISWGALLGSLPKEMADDLLAEAREANAPAVGTTTAAEEVAQVKAAVLRMDAGPPPENMFAPFSVVGELAPQGALVRDPSPLVHWAHVDSGS